MKVEIVMVLTLFYSYCRWRVQDTLTLISVRHVHTGDYVPFFEMQKHARHHGIPVVTCRYTTTRCARSHLMATAASQRSSSHTCIQDGGGGGRGLDYRIRAVPEDHPREEHRP
jgi:N-acetyl-anhydromuramyl-L-alanine amidase AmpD